MISLFRQARKSIFYPLIVRRNGFEGLKIKIVV